jgi:small multidrug resistance family-3 protein
MRELLISKRSKKCSEKNFGPYRFCRRIIGFILGTFLLFAYGVMVNTLKWDFGRLLGIYIVIFFIVSQFLSVVIFHETFRLSTLIGGILITSGGVIFTL